MINSVAYLDSPIGILRLSGIGYSLCRISFPETKGDDELRSERLAVAIEQLNEFFSGARTHFTIPIHMTGTNFQQNVWEELEKIPFGKTCNYEDLAKKLGDIKVIRAAAAANGKNPLAIIVPCHRVIGKDGSLTGYSGGLWRKKWLLDFEQRDIQPRLL